MKQQPNRLLFSLIAALLSGLLLMPAATVAADTPLRIYGAGATFPAPLLLNWMHNYTAGHPSIQPDYQGTSSAGGLKDLAEGRIDFTAADFRLSEADAATMAGGVVQFPIAVAGIALIYNLPEIGQLRLSREAVIGIFGGEISNWNDPVIAKTNPNAALPDLPITLVARAGASGTSYNLTAHLGAISPNLANRLGITMTPAWSDLIERPGGLIRGSGNDGVTTLVRSIPGSIGYVAYPYADFTNTPMAAVENQDGQLVAPNPLSFAASMEAIRHSRDIATLIDPPGQNAYPLIAPSFLMLRKQYEDPQKQRALLDLVEYALGPGQKTAARIGYIPFSAAAIEFVKQELSPLRQPAD